MLDRIGFYTLSEKRVSNASSMSPLMRGEMILTNRCNFHCVYCRGLTGNANRELSWKEIEYGLMLWIASGLRNVRFSGGEPVLHPDLVDAVRLCRDKGVNRIAVSSNGSMPVEKYDELLEAGVNDFSISLDACCASMGDTMAGVKDSWTRVVENIRYLSSKTYTTVGIVLTEYNISQSIETIIFAHALGVADIRIIPAAQYQRENARHLIEIPDGILAAHPILRYRVTRAGLGHSVRGISKVDSHRCALVLDDSVIAGNSHFPCVVYLREGGREIGKVNNEMRRDRESWYHSHNSFYDAICRNNCLDVCIEYNNRYSELHHDL